MNAPVHPPTRRKTLAWPFGSARLQRWLEQPTRAVLALVWTATLLALALVPLALSRAIWRSPPRVQPRLPALFSIPPFTLTNQNRQPVTLADLRGQVWVADIIFTRCEGPCPKMTQRLSELQALLPPDAPVKLVTLTTDPQHDTPEILRKYGQRFGASPDRWWFLTGDKRALANLAIDGLKLVATEKTPTERTSDADLFVHSTCVVLIDQSGQARGLYYYGDTGMKERLLEDITLLLSAR
jgi:cytochrome oxidase Cu insertion factor (SCO1/SenC/PrrC family)